MNVCTIVAKNYLAHARVLAESFKEHHPNSTCTVLIMDDPEGTIKAEPFEILRVEDVGIPRSHQWKARHEITEFSAMIKPWLLKHLLDRGASHVAYLDPDIQIFAPLDDIAELAEKHGIVLTPYVMEPIPRDREKPTEHEILSAGAYDSGFIAVGAGETSTAFLNWWTDGLSKDYSVEAPRHIIIDREIITVDRTQPIFTGRRWINAVPSLFRSTQILEDPACDVAYWNLHARALARDDSIVTVNGQRLRFFHFSGFRLEFPYWLSQYGTRVKLSENGILLDLCKSYADLLEERGYQEAIRTPYRYEVLPNGLVYDKRLRRLHEEAVAAGEDFGDVFEPEGLEAFLKWLNGPSQWGGHHGITRFMHDGIYTERPDVQQAFKDLNGPAGEAFVDWFAIQARRDYELPDELVPIKLVLPNGLVYDKRLRRLHEEAVAAGEDFGDVFEPEGLEAFLKWLNGPSQWGGHHGITRFMHDGIYTERPDVQQAFKDLNGPAGEAFVDWFVTHGLHELNLPEQLVPFDPTTETTTIEPDSPQGAFEEPQPVTEIDGVNVVGYFTGEMGLGEVARQNISALKSAGVAVATKTVTHSWNINNHDFAELDSPTEYSTNLVCLQPLELRALYEQDVELFDGRSTIGVWGWELDIWPEEYLRSLEIVDEVWVWTSYVAENLSRSSSKPVAIVPPPVVVRDPGDATVDLGIPEGFTFLFIFDFHSVVQRKNPLGLIEAFKRAFAPGEEPQLVIKSINGDSLPQYLEQLKVAAFNRPDIHIVDRYISAQEKSALMAGCDCYVSLHRSEGFGLTPAEAMALGRPVIATGYSGITDFMTNENSYLVDYSLTEVGPNYPPYPAEGLWADPDLDHAASLMRHVWENPEEAKDRGKRAQRDIEETLSPEAVGKVMQERLARLPRPTTVPSPKKTQTHPTKVADVEEKPMVVEKLEAAKNKLKQGPAVEAPSRLGHVGRFARRLVLRGMHPFTSYQGQLDTAIIGAVQETARKIETVRSRLSHQQKRLETQQKRCEAESFKRDQDFQEQLVEHLEALKRIEATALKRDRAIEGRLGNLEAKSSSDADNVKVGSVPARETYYLGHTFLYPYDSLIGEIINRGQEWDAVLRPLVTELLPHEEPVICEVGSNIGASLLQMIAAKPRAHLLAFEPSSRFQPFLERNLQMANVEDSVEIVPLLLGREPGSMWLHNNSSSASVVSADYDEHTPRGKQLIEMTTLDEVLRDRTPVDFIKTDTDGYDFEVLRGAEATLRQDQPVLYFELEPALIPDPLGELAWLQSLGYQRFVCVRPQGKVHGGIVLIHGITEDPEQVIAWANEDSLCDILTCPKGSPAEACLEHIEFTTRVARRK